MLNHITMFQPSAIDNAFSTLQIIHKLIKHMNKVIDEVNSIDSKANEYTDEQIRLTKNELNSRIDDVIISIGQLETELKQFAKDYTDTQIDDLKNEYIHNKLVEVYEAIEVVNDRLTTLYERLDIKIDRTKNELEYLIEVTKAELIELIKKGGAIYSGVTGELTNAEKTIKQLVDKVQHKNGMSWNNIINLIMTQTPPSAELQMVEKLSFPVGDENVYVSKNVFNKLFNPYNSNPYIYLSSEGSTQNYIGAAIQATSVDNKFFSVRINGEALPLSTQRLTGVSDTEFANTVFIPLYRKYNNAYEFSYFNVKWNVRQLKRLNTLEIVTSTGVYNTFIYVDAENLPFKNVTWDDIITSCNTNKNYNTWDSLTYYTIKFMGEHLCTADYSIPIDSEFEEVASGNAINNQVSFYHNKL